MASSATSQNERLYPGQGSMWFFVVGDLWIFTCYFACYIHDRGQNPDAFLLGQQLLSQATGNLPDVAPLIAALLSVPTGERYPPLDLTPQKRKERTLLAQVAQVEGLSARQPVLMVYEDMHWSDPTTRESMAVGWLASTNLFHLSEPLSAHRSACA